MKLTLTIWDDNHNPIVHDIGDFSYDACRALDDHPTHVDDIIALECQYGVLDYGINGDGDSATGGYTSGEISPEDAPLVAELVRKLIEKDI